MKARAKVVALQILRNNRVQLQCSVDFHDPLTSGHIQIQLPIGAAEKLLGQIGLDETFELQLSTANKASLTG